MQLVARTLRHLAIRYLIDPRWSSQDTARQNAAGASAELQKRRQDLADIDAYFRERGIPYGSFAETGASDGRRRA
jgi:hypothetical protein